MKKIVLIIPLLFLALFSYACPACEKQQPKLLRGISHGTGPQSDWDYVVISFMVIVVILTFYFSLKWIIKPGEKSPTHIKRLILKEE